MRKKLLMIHVFFIQTILNIYPFFIIDIFYDNQTYIGYQLHKPFYLWLWSLSTVFGLYTYSKMIWSKYKVHFSVLVHNFSCLCMILGTIIPYQTHTILMDLHVWICILGVVLFLYEWFHNIPIHLNKNSILFFINIGLSLFFTLIFGHVTSFCEIYFSFTTNLLLYRWIVEFY